MPTTLYPDGVSSALAGSLGATYPLPEFSRAGFMFDEFYTLSAAAGTTDATWRALGVNPVVPTVAAASFGRALFAPVAAADSTYLQLAGTRTAAAGSLPLTYFFVAGRDMWFQTLFQVSDATSSVINAGFFPSVAAAGDPTVAADGVFFTKASGSTTLSLKAIKTAVGNSLVTVATLANATDIKIGLWYSANADRIFAFVNDVQTASIPTTNMPAVGLLPLIGHTSIGAARTSSWDFVFAAQARQAETN